MTTTVRITELPTGTPDSTAVFPYVSVDETLGETTVDVTRACVGADLNATHIHVAADIPSTPAGDLAATTVQDALNELDSEKLPTVDYTAADVLAKLIQVDGEDSGLDADLFRGTVPSDYALASHTHPAGQIEVTPTGGITETSLQLVLAALDARLTVLETP